MPDEVLIGTAMARRHSKSDAASSGEVTVGTHRKKHLDMLSSQAHLTFSLQISGVRVSIIFNALRATLMALHHGLHCHKIWAILIS